MDFYYRYAVGFVIVLFLAGCSQSNPGVQKNTPTPPVVIVPNAERLIGEATDRNILSVAVEVDGPRGSERFVCTDPSKIERFVFRSISAQPGEARMRDAKAKFTFKRPPQLPGPSSIPVSRKSITTAGNGFVRTLKQ
ncbi:hypothetical protein MCEMSE15_01079 [Fimbriimonadaceae bacterium]